MNDYDFGLRGPRETTSPRGRDTRASGEQIWRHASPEQQRRGRSGSEWDEPVDNIRQSDMTEERAGVAQRLSEGSEGDGGGGENAFWDQRPNRRGRNPDQI